MENKRLKPSLSSLENQPRSKSSSIEKLPQEIRKHIIHFISTNKLNSLAQLSKSWNFIAKQTLITRLKSLTPEEFNYEFARCIFENNFFLFKTFITITRDKQGWPKTLPHWIEKTWPEWPEFLPGSLLGMKEEQAWPKLVFNWLFDKRKGKPEKIEENTDCYSGRSLLYAAIENENDFIAMYLIEQLESTANDPEYKEIEGWANDCISIGYADDDSSSADISPLLKALLMKNDFIAKALIKRNLRINISKDYWRMEETKDCYYTGHSYIIAALERQRRIIEQMHSEEINKKDEALKKALQELEELKSLQNIAGAIIK